MQRHISSQRLAYHCRNVEQSCAGRWLNLRPFMFRAPLLMQQGASLTRALSLFRQMGLHHILVAPPDPRAIGFITRKVGLAAHPPSLQAST